MTLFKHKLQVIRIPAHLLHISCADWYDSVLYHILKISSHKDTKFLTTEPQLRQNFFCECDESVRGRKGAGGGENEGKRNE